MITRNYKNYMKATICRTYTPKPLNLPITRPNGEVKYFCPNLGSGGFPQNWNKNLTLSSGGSGISVGTGGTAATENDVRLENQITSGLSATITDTIGVDQNGSPYVSFIIVLENTSSETKTIREIGYGQNLYWASSASSTSYNDYDPFLFDRTVLSSPLEIAAGDFASIRYTLKISEPS